MPRYTMLTTPTLKPLERATPIYSPSLLLQTTPTHLLLPLSAASQPLLQPLIFLPSHSALFHADQRTLPTTKTGCLLPWTRRTSILRVKSSVLNKGVNGVG